MPEKGKKKQLDHKDFDEALAEKREQKIGFKVRGKEYEVPSSPPLSIVFEIERLFYEKGADADLESRTMKNIFAKIVGEDNIDQMIDDGVTLEEMQSIFRWLWLNKYKGIDTDVKVKNSKNK